MQFFALQFIRRITPPYPPRGGAVAARRAHNRRSGVRTPFPATNQLRGPSQEGPLCVRAAASAVLTRRSGRDSVLPWKDRVRNPKVRGPTLRCLYPSPLPTNQRPPARGPLCFPGSAVLIAQLWVEQWSSRWKDRLVTEVRGPNPSGVCILPRYQPTQRPFARRASLLLGGWLLPCSPRSSGWSSGHPLEGSARNRRSWVQIPPVFVSLPATNQLRGPSQEGPLCIPRPAPSRLLTPCVAWSSGCCSSTSHLTPHTSHLTPHASRLTPHVSRLTLFLLASVYHARRRARLL